MDRTDPGDRLLLAAALLVALISVLLGQHDRQLWAPDEAREAGITAAMARTGDRVVPRLNGRPFLEKPPLFHAAGAAVLDATGSRSPFAVRLPAALFALATLAATFAIGRRLGGNRLGAIAALALATTGGFHSAAHRAVTDNAIPPFVALSFLGLVLLLDGGAKGPAFALAGAAAGVSFIAKGAVGPAIIAVGWIAALLGTARVRLLRDRRVAVAALLALLPPAMWLLALHRAEGTEAIRTVLVRNNWDRAAAATPDHAGGPLYYLLRAPSYLLPWFPLAVLGALRAWRAGGPRRVPVAWLGGGLLLLTLAAAKRPIYLLPLAPAAALLAAVEVEAMFFGAPESPRAGLARGAMAWTAVLGVVAGAALDAWLRPGDILLAAAGFAAGAAGAAALLRLPLPTGPAPAVASIFLLSAIAIALGFRALGPSGDEERGMDGLVEDVVAEAEGREVVLFRPSEALEGILTFRLDRDLPSFRRADDLLAFAAASDRALLVVAREGDPRLPEAWRAARVLRRRTAGKADLVLVAPPRRSE
jgi:4-amino-4-deoxy-L-arabinose transferase-like glycosyltransferase